MNNICLYRLPNNDEIILLGSETTELIKHFDFEQHSTGFVIHPFDVNEPSLFIPSEILIKNPTSTQLNELNFNKSLFNQSETQEVEYVNYVNESVDCIDNNTFKKVVPAKTKFLQTDSSNEIELFYELCKLYKNSFISLISTQKYGTWIGASPEILLSINSKNILHTVALAGTQQATETDIKNTVWNTKEIEEQALVSRFIIYYFKQIRLREFEEIGPKTIKAGNLLHLKTDYYIKLNEVEHRNLPTTLLHLLHPTSAVCGLPKEPAMAFIKEHEHFDRELFSGFIGPVSIENETHLYVNLRCAKVYKNGFQLFAGAGVTSQSNAEAEWEETERKCAVLTNAIKNLTLHKINQ